MRLVKPITANTTGNRIYGRAVKGRRNLPHLKEGLLERDREDLSSNSTSQTWFIARFSQCFVDTRDPRYLEHTVKEMITQRTVGLCLGYEETNDHDELRRDPLLATVCGKLDREKSAFDASLRQHIPLSWIDFLTSWANYRSRKIKNGPLLPAYDAASRESIHNPTSVNGL